MKENKIQPTILYNWVLGLRAHWKRQERHIVTGTWIRQRPRLARGGGQPARAISTNIYVHDTANTLLLRFQVHCTHAFQLCE